MYLGTIADDGQHHPFLCGPCVGLAILAHLYLAQAQGAGVEAELSVHVAVVGEAEEHGLAFIGIGEFAQTVGVEGVAFLVLVGELVVVPLVGVEFPLEGDGGRVQGHTLAPDEGAVGVIVGHVEHLVPAGGVVVLVLNLGGLLGNLDGLQDGLGAGGINLHFTGTDFVGGVVFQLEGDGVGGGLHANHADPGGFGLYINGCVGNHVGLDGAVGGFSQVVNFLGIGFVGNGGIVLFAFCTKVEFHNGGETHLGIRIGQGGTFHYGLGGDDKFVGLYRGAKVAVRKDVNHRVVGLGLHGVGHVERVGGGYGILGLGNHQLEGIGQGKLDGGIVGKGKHNGLVGYGNGGENAVLELGAAAEAAQFLGLAVNDGVEFPVFYVDVGNGTHKQVLSFVLKNDSVNGPAEVAGGVFHNGKGARTAAGGHMDREDGSVSVGNGKSVGGFFYLLDKLAQGNLLDDLHLSNQVVHLGFERGDPVLEFSVIVLFGTAHQEQGHGKSSE